MEIEFCLPVVESEGFRVAVLDTVFAAAVVDSGTVASISAGTTSTVETLVCCMLCDDTLDAYRRGYARRV